MVRRGRDHSLTANLIHGTAVHNQEGTHNSKLLPEEQKLWTPHLVLQQQTEKQFWKGLHEFTVANLPAHSAEGGDWNTPSLSVKEAIWLS